MSDEQTPVDINDDLDAFSADFFNPKPEIKEPPVVEEVKTEEIEDAPEEDLGDDTPANDENETEEPEEKDEKPEPKPKKNRFQERIDELTSKAREAERERDALITRLEKLEQTEKPIPKSKVEESTGPSPDDKNEDGSDKYALGEFDPFYIRDLTRYTLATEREALKVQEQQEAARQEVTNQRAALQADWESKLGPAKERYPDFHEKGDKLITSFDGLDQAYGEYLTATLMSMEYGTDVLYYLANNPSEAKKIVESGPAKATMSLGRIEAKFAFAEEEKQKARPKVSKAPTPPAHVNKGSAVSLSEVPDDTDDLDAFSSKFFVKKGR